LLRVGESEDMVVAENDSRASPQFLWLCDESAVDECLTVWVRNDADGTFLVDKSAVFF
jgi:hypothetical protein